VRRPPSRDPTLTLLPTYLPSPVPSLGPACVEVSTPPLPLIMPPTALQQAPKAVLRVEKGMMSVGGMGHWQRRGTDSEAVATTTNIASLFKLLGLVLAAAVGTAPQAVSAFQFMMWEAFSQVNGVVVTNCPGGTPLVRSSWSPA
jgi:hypothetical protein